MPDLLRLEHRRDAATLARRHVRAAVLHWGLDELVDPALLLTSELVTNALLHGDSQITLLVVRDGRGVRVTVGDGSSVPPIQRRRSASASSGRGVQLLGAIADGWGWEQVGDGKQVWFRLLSAARWSREPVAEVSADADW